MTRITGFILLTAALILSACDSGPTEVPRLVVDRVEVGPTDRTIVAGDTMRLHAYPKTEDGTILGSVRIDWSSDLADVVDLSANGLVRGLKPGKVEITATSEGKSGKTTVTVVAAVLPVDRVEISPPLAGMTVGQQINVEARLYAADNTLLGGRHVTWTSSQPTRATVNSHGDPALALVAAHSPGQVTIKAAAEGKSAEYTFDVVVQPAPAVGWVRVTPGEMTAWVGNIKQLTATAYNTNGTPMQNPPPITWSVGNPSVLELSPNGTIRALKRGSTVVTASAAGKSGTALVHVFLMPTDSMTFILRPNEDAAGNGRIGTQIGKKTWYDANGVGHEATMFVAGGAIKLVHSGATPRFQLTWRIDLIAHIGGYGETVATEFVEETGTYSVVYEINTGMPAYRLERTSPAATPIGRWVAPGRLNIPMSLGTAATQDWIWGQVY